VALQAGHGLGSAGFPSALSRSEWAAEFFLQAGDELGTAHRPAGEGSTLQGANGSQFLRLGQQCSPSLSAARVGVKLPIEPRGRGADTDVCGGAGPCVLLGPLDQVCADRVTLDIAQRNPEVPLIEGARVEAGLEEMAHAPAARVEIQRIAAVGTAQSDGHGGGLVRDDDQMDVIGHQAIGENAQPGLFTVGLETVQIRLAVGVGEEDALVVDAALSDMMRHTYGHGARETGHMLGKWSAERISLPGPYLSVPVFHNSSGQPLLALGFAWGGATDNGNLTQATVASGSNSTFTQNFTYDNVNRLSTANETAASTQYWSFTFGYDQYGNMWVPTWSGSGLPAPPITSNIYTNNFIGTGTSYDSAGNQTLVGGNTLTFDAENHQVQVAESQSNGGGTETYAYDGDGHRVQKSGPAGTATFLYDALGRLAGEIDSVAAAPTCVTCYLSPDHLGTSRLTTDANGAVTDCHDYLPFGVEIPASVSGRAGCYNSNFLVDNVNQKFTGKERDAESGLDYFGARYFSGAQGRFTSPDPLLNAGRPDNPQTWNKYAYTLNNPLKYTDPTGLYEWSQKCGDDDAQCQANRQQFRDALATIRNAANQYEEGSDERNKLEAVLDKYGDEGEKNKVSIKFGEAGGFPAKESTSLFGKKTITFDMKMLGDSFRNSNSINPDYKPSIGWGEVVAHEGAHMLDRFAFGNPVNRTGALRTETNAFDTQSFVPKATNQYSFCGKAGTERCGPS